MAVRIATYKQGSRERLEELRRRKRGGRATNPVMDDLLNDLAASAPGTPFVVRLEPGQNARGVKISLSRRARERGLALEMFDDLEPERDEAGEPAKDDEGKEITFPVVVIAKTAAPPRGGQSGEAPGTPPPAPKRRGRPPRHRQQDDGETGSEVAPPSASITEPEA